MASRGRPRSFPLHLGCWSDDHCPTNGRPEVFQAALYVLSCRTPDPARRRKLAAAARRVTTWTQAVRAITGTMHTRGDDGTEKAEALVAFVAHLFGRLPKDPKDRASPNREPNEKALREAARTQKASEIARLIQMWVYCQPDLYVRAMMKSATTGERPAVAFFIHRGQEEVPPGFEGPFLHRASGQIVYVRPSAIVRR